MPKRRDVERVHLDRLCVGMNVRDHRERAGLARGEFAAMLHAHGITTLYEQALGRLERGHRDLSLPEAVAVAAVLGLDLSALTVGLVR